MIAANDLYHVVPIEGKGFGCVALKDIKVGTLIIEEIPQFPPAKKETGDLVCILFSLMECFNSMSETDKGTSYSKGIGEFCHLQIKWTKYCPWTLIFC